MSHSYVGLVRQRAGRPAEAAAEFQKAVAIMERLANLQPSSYDLYNLACFQSLLSGIAAQPGSGLTDADVRQPGWHRPSQPCAGPSTPVCKTSRSCEGTPTSIPCDRAGLSTAAIGPGFPRTTVREVRNEHFSGGGSVDHDLSCRRDDPGPVGPIRIFQHRREGNRHVRGGHAQPRAPAGCRRIAP